jgi:outer membrane protein TolC
VIPPLAQQEHAPPPPTPPGMENLIPPPAAPSPVPMPTVTIPSIVTGLPNGTTPTLTLDQVLTRVLATNPTILLSEQRLKLAQAQVQQGEATGFPHVNVSAADTYYGEPTTAGPSSVAIPSTNFSTPIPSVVDAAQGQTFTGGGGTLGTTSTQLGASSGGTGASATSPTTGATVTPVSPSNPTPTSSTTNNTGVSGTGGSPIAGGGAGQSPQAVHSNDVSQGSDPILQQYESVMQQQSSEQAVGEGPSAAPAAAGGSNNNNNVKTWHNVAGGSINLSQLLDVFGLVGTGVSVLKENVQFYEIDLSREMNEEALTVKNAYFAAINDQNDVASAQEQVTNATATLSTAEAQFAAGVVPMFDVVSAQTQLSTAQAQLLTTQNQFNTQIANLDNLMGLPSGSVFTLAPPPLPDLAATYNETDEIGKAYTSRPEMRQVALDEDIAKKLVKLAYAGYLPTFAIGAGVNYTGNVAVAGNSHYSEQVTAQMNFPLYDGGQTQSQVRQAKINLQTEQTTENQLRQNIALEVEAALINLQNAASLVRADEDTVNQARTSLRLAEISYRAGVGTLLDVENAQAEVASAEQSLSQAEFQLQTSYAALERAEGGR